MRRPHATSGGIKTDRLATCNGSCQISSVPGRKGQLRSRARRPVAPDFTRWEDGGFQGDETPAAYGKKPACSTCTPGTGRDDGPEGKCVRCRPRGGRAEAPAP